MATPAAQNFQVSGTGGAGTSGQGKKYIPGMNQMGSSGTETMAQQGGALMYKTPDVPAMKPVTSITAPSELPEQNVMHGSMGGPGPNSVPGLKNPQTDPDLQLMQNYFPILEFWASQPGSSQASKDYVNYLSTVIDGTQTQ